MVMVSKYWACLSARLMRGPKVEEVVNISMFLREKQPLIYIYKSLDSICSQEVTSSNICHKPYHVSWLLAPGHPSLMPLRAPSRWRHRTCRERTCGPQPNARDMLGWIAERRTTNSSTQCFATPTFDSFCINCT